MAPVDPFTTISATVPATNTITLVVPDTPAATPAAASAASVRVSVTRDQARGIRVQFVPPAHEPSVAEVYANLPKALQKHISRRSLNRRFYGVSQFITDHQIISNQQWADAIGAAIIQRDNNANPGTFDSNIVKGNTYLTMGDTLYKLSPVEVVKTNKALALARRVAKEHATAEIEAYKNQNKAAVDALLADASQKRAEAARVLTEAQSSVPPPQWVKESHFPIRWYNRGWQVAIPVQFVVEGYDFNYNTDAGDRRLAQWESVSPAVRKVIVWSPINNFSASSLCLDALHRQLPHIGHGNACLSIGENIEQIDSVYAVSRLATALTRAFSRVQLDSLLNAQALWLPDFENEIPEDLLAALRSHNVDAVRRLAIRLERDENAEHAEVEEGEDVWTA